MDAPWDRRGPDGRARRRRVGFTAEVLTLEDRRLPAVGSVTATVSPKLLTPNRGEVTTVHVTGQVQQALTVSLAVGANPTDPEYYADVAQNDAKPVPTQVFAEVTDRYRQDEPRITVPLDPTPVSEKSFFRATPKGTHLPAAVVTVRYFNYSIPIPLVAKAAANGRQYAITVFSTDNEGGAQTTAFAYVPYRSAGGKK